MHNHVLVLVYIFIFYYHACMYSHFAASVMFQLVGDNVDLYQKPRYMTAEHKAKTYHWFQVCAVKNCVNAGETIYLNA